MTPKSLAIFGATGSVGTSTLDIVRRQPDAYRAAILTARSNGDAMLALVREFCPDLVVMADPAAALSLQAALKGCQPRLPVLAGPEGLRHAAEQPYDLMVAAIVGFAGLAPTLAAVSAGRDVALANKEALVCAGHLIMATAAAQGARILPLDSEHNAIFQCWEDRNRDRILNVQLTASGGPFRGWQAHEVAQASLEQALRHPNWSMGAKITIDSATLMNKALEMIEAHWLFNLTSDQLEVVIHPQSIVHSCVTYADGTTLAQMGHPDMRTPIAYCLAYPDRARIGSPPISLTQVACLTFESPDEAVFPTLALARAAMLGEAARGTGLGLALNAVNEVLNAAVRAQRLPFGRLMPTLCAMMDSLEVPRGETLEDLIALDTWVRAETIARMGQWRV